MLDVDVGGSGPAIAIDTASPLALFWCGQQGRVCCLNLSTLILALAGRYRFCFREAATGGVQLGPKRKRCALKCVCREYGQACPNWRD